MTRQHEPPLYDDAALLARLQLDDRPGPAARISSARAHAMVESALAAAFADLGRAPQSSAPPRLSAPTAAAPLRWLQAQRPLVRALTLAAAGLLALVGGAAAAKLVGWTREAPARAPSVSRAGAPKTGAHRAASVPVAPSVLEEPGVAETDEAAAQDALEAATTEVRGRRSGAARMRDAREGVLEDLLQQANRARAAGEFREAAELYAQVYEGRPSSLSAYVAQVAAASLELEHLDRPARARKLFEAALRSRPSGALDLEARQGLALSLRDLGARSDESAALRTLIARHPARPAAARARARLAELGE